VRQLDLNNVTYAKTAFDAKNGAMTPKKQKPTSHEPTGEADSLPRIVGGAMRGRKLHYSGDPRTRPMKERVREAVFNLIGPAVKGKHAIDLFAGTGALGLEAISRGAVGATLVERHFPTADLIKKNAAELGVENICTVFPANVLLWAKRLPPLPTTPWVVFCSPPYDLYVEQTDAMLELLRILIEHAPAESSFCVEADERFDFGLLPNPGAWDVRRYPPAIVGIWRKLSV
jgi:16S rRNA (guanine966-N2)-methyltransferase